MKILKESYTYWLLGIILIFAWGINHDRTHISVCDHEVTVLEIVGANHRTVYVMTEDGKIGLDQPRDLYVGKKICRKSHRETIKK